VRETEPVDGGSAVFSALGTPIEALAVAARFWLSGSGIAVSG
jgi:hypothetical protein